MRRLLLTATAVALMAVSGLASAKGCVAGAAAGGLAGHVAGHHAIIGAAAGCAINHHRNAVKDEKAAAVANQQTTTPAPIAQTPTKQN